MPTGIELRDLQTLIIRPVTISLGLGGANVEELLVLTAAQESGLGRSLDQNGGGPALGVWQMEPVTHDDIWGNFLAYRAELANKILTWTFSALPKPLQMIGNLYYACAMARVQYLRSPHAIPPVGDRQGQWQIYKIAYNTALGAATEAQFMENVKGVVSV